MEGQYCGAKNSRTGGTDCNLSCSNVSFQGRFADLVFFGIDIVLRKIYLKETFKKIDLYYIVILYFRDVV